MTADVIVTVLAGLAMFVGIVGIVVPVLPGSATIAVAALVWAIVAGTGPGWSAFAAITVLVALGMAAGWVLTGRRLKERGIPNRSLLIGGILAVVGFFVVPVIGLLLGFVGGLWAAEWQRLGDARKAWDTSWAAIKAAGIGILIEFGCAALALAVFSGTVIHHFVTA
ncbi:MAG: DUF456 domain-containing protein [Brevibacterium yomogidense]|uniref:DUF456 domain-containing protein n=1 Tax=Brevibacterium TaxID=1696 RepID=UPI000B352992|nr:MULTISPECIES: DUF456 domain-containing protein [Brevibacterium]SMX72464.1 hypothetical protein BSP109_00914 [Brevibacterium sp. Mu109]